MKFDPLLPHVVAVKHDINTVSVFVLCPYCGKRHLHGDRLGPRAADCGRGGYNITDHALLIPQK